MKVDSSHRGSIAGEWLWDKGWKLEGMVNYGPNVVSFMLKTGWKQWYAVGAYITPSEQPEVRRVEQSLERCPAQTERLLVRDLNSRFRRM